MQLGFVIDHSRCIGCHACTVACKSENHVPLGSFRTWVKYVEEGEYPRVRRSFAVLRCNQCSDAPCVTICPVRALDKRSDGIVDVDPGACIGCKACMQGCPYDALYIHPDTGTAQKCHFCAHRTEIGLAPACAVVCPTEAIIPGDFHDPDSAVSRLARAADVTARKVEAGTGPNVRYREASPAALDPARTSGAGGSIWADTAGGPHRDAQLWESLEGRAKARTVYDVAHPALWGWRISGYLFAKSLAAGAFLAAAPFLPPFSRQWPAWLMASVPLATLVFLVVTSALLVADLKRPERFLKILLRPNWSSWLARGSFALAAYGLAITAWLVGALVGWQPRGGPAWALWGATCALAAVSAAYTGWLFGQARGRPLWMRRGLWLHLLVQAVVAGAALWVLLAPFAGAVSDTDLLELGLSLGVHEGFRRLLLGALGIHLCFVVLEGRGAPPRRGDEYRRAHDLVVRGPFARAHWLFGIGVGIVLPGLLLLIPGPPIWWVAAGALALVGLAVEEDLLVRAGQALPIS